jgi:hypothetical protein
MPIKATPRFAPALATPTNLRRLAKLGEATTSTPVVAGAPNNRAASGPTNAGPGATLKAAPGCEGAKPWAAGVGCKARNTQAEPLQPRANQMAKVNMGMPHCAGANR